ncbi:sigma-54 dependent transcriptional regulator [Paracoccaceae bacterium]|nr:sigma-54 dependent transcriptional regulator [Paracoccaceae bacterium]
MDGTVLVADDDRTIRTVLTQALTRAGCRVHATSSLTTLMRWVGEGKGDAVITDVMMPDGNGLEMLPKISLDRPELPVIVISAQNTIMTAIQAAEAEAFDYLPKPFDLPDLMKRCARALEQKQPVASKPQFEVTPDVEEDGLPLVGKTPAMQGLYRLVARVMNSDLPVLISGESGTGKTLIAKVLHDYSDRRNLPFVVVNETDLVALDGPAKILARAKGGTILFEEITDINEEGQGRIVRMIDNPGEFSPRFIATMQGEVSGEVDPKMVRSDLYYRLGGATIHAPALRERVDDIQLLSAFFLARAERDGGLQRVVTKEAEQLFRNYSWPGNVRQLENVVKRLSLTARASEITLTEVEQVLGSQPAMNSALQKGSSDRLSADVERHLRRYFDLHGSVLPPPGLHARILKELEHPLISIALEATGGNQAKCADLLGINRNTLRKKINELDIKVTRRRKLM